MTALPVLAHPVAALVESYLAGSVPFAYLAGRARGVDLRTVGSGNLGATNVVRTLGKPMGVAVFLCDVAKGFVPTWFLVRWVDATWGAPGSVQLFAIMIGVVAILGHARPVFLGFQRGGKGVATATGVFLALAWPATLVAFVVWLAVFRLSGYVSLGSLAAAVALPLAMLLTGVSATSSVFVTGVVIATLVFYTHRANIVRLRRGEEHRFGRPPDADAGVAR